MALTPEGGCVPVDLSSTLTKELHRRVIHNQHGFLESKETADWVEESLSSAMLTLSIDKEDELAFDISGFTPGIEEERPGDITYSKNSHQWNAGKTKLRKLVQEIERRFENGVHEDFRKAYSQALQQNPKFLQQQGLLFVTSMQEGNEYNFEAAAELLLDHLKVKGELFGRDKLGRHILWNDLSSREQELVSLGFLQFAPNPDSAGRAVLHFCFHRLLETLGNDIDDETTACVVRAQWYVIFCALRTNSSLQSNGLVICGCNITNTTLGMRSSSYARRRLAFIPIRLRVLHVFYTSPRLTIRYKLLELSNILSKFKPRRHRCRVHLVASISELRQEMSILGIDPDASPWAYCSVDFSVWSRNNHLEWLEEQKRRDQKALSSLKNTGGTWLDDSEIRPFDVLFGKNKTAKEHPGTRRCKVLVSMQRDAYEKVDTPGKTKIANDIVESVYTAGGRFLRMEKGEWVQVTFNVARGKIAHMFRFLRSKEKDHNSKSTAPT